VVGDVLGEPEGRFDGTDEGVEDGDIVGLFEGT